MANIALDAGKVVLKDGKASCTCCGGVVCPSIESEYDVISEAIYNALQAGGNYAATGSLREPGYGTSQTECNMSASSSGIIASGNCGASITINQQTCFASYTFNQAYIGFSYQISKVGTEYRFTYGYGGNFGSAYCPWDITSSTCYSVGYNVSWFLDNNPGGLFCPIAGGGITLNTSAGTLGPFGIHTFCGFGSTGFMNITITPFT
jgi:hypothetical protein